MFAIKINTVLYCDYYYGDLKSRLVRISNSWKEVGLQMVLISKGIWNPEAGPFEIQANGCHFVQKPFKIWTKRCGMIQFSNGWNYSYSPICWKLDHLKSDIFSRKFSEAQKEMQGLRTRLTLAETKLVEKESQILALKEENFGLKESLDKISQQNQMALNKPDCKSKFNF